MAEANIATFALQPITEIRHMPKSRDWKLLVYTSSYPSFLYSWLLVDSATLLFTLASQYLILATDKETDESWDIFII